MTDAIRTPDELFADIPDFPYEPRFRTIADGLRLAYIDEGEGEPIVLFHGEPTWSYLWRKVIPPLLAGGYRVIAPDLAGFGRSDKPIDIDWYTYDRHSELMVTFIEELDLRNATAVVHDWGGPIGLRTAVELPDRFAKIAILDTGLFTGHQKMTDAWMAFRNFVEKTEDLPVGFLVKGACHTDPGDQVIAAYDAPFPSAASKAGARAFPLMIPLTPESPGAEAGTRVFEALKTDIRPKLVLWAENDPILPLKVGEKFAAALGVVLEPIPDASHFLQEDQGELIGQRIAAWLATGV